MSVVIRLEVPIAMYCTVIPMGTSKLNSSPYYNSLLTPERDKYELTNQRLYIFPVRYRELQESKN